jgi:hypothetical protein
MPIAAAIPYVVAATGVYSAVSTANAAKKAASATADAGRTAVEGQRAIVDNLKYEPINIEKLRADATKQAIENATGALQLERSLNPALADTRSELSKQINADLARGGELPPDVANRVASEARTVGARSGSQDSAAPLTAALMGISSLDLQNSRRAAASNLLSANPLAPTGLDPGAVASLEVADNAANNQFNLEKAGASSNLVNSELSAANAAAKADTAKAGANAGVASSLASLLGQFYKPTTTSGTPSTTTAPFNYTMPKFNYSLLGSTPVS